MMITPYILKGLLFLWAGIGAVLGIRRSASLGIGIGIGKEKMVSEHIPLEHIEQSVSSEKYITSL